MSWNFLWPTKAERLPKKNWLWGVYHTSKTVWKWLWSRGSKPEGYIFRESPKFELFGARKKQQRRWRTHNEGPGCIAPIFFEFKREWGNRGGGCGHYEHDITQVVVHFMWEQSAGIWRQGDAGRSIDWKKGAVNEEVRNLHIALPRAKSNHIFGQSWRICAVYTDLLKTDDPGLKISGCPRGGHVSIWKQAPKMAPINLSGYSINCTWIQSIKALF